MFSTGRSDFSVSAAAPAAVAAVGLLLLVLDEVFSNRTHDSSAHSAEEAVTSFLACEVTTEAAANSAEKAAVTLGHGWGIRVVVGSVAV